MARAGGLSEGRRQRRSRLVPASLLIRARHPDEGGRPVRRGRAGVRPRLRDRPRRAGPPRRQRAAVLHRGAARRRAVRSVRDLPARSAAARSAAQRRAKVSAADVGRRLGARGQIAAARPARLSDQRASTMLSRPIGFAQQGAAGFDSRMISASTAVDDCGLASVAKLPNVLPTVFCTTNAVAPLAMPVIEYGICVVLEYRSTDWNLNFAPPLA